MLLKTNTNYFKLNVDGTMFFDIHNEKGDLVLAASKVEKEVHDPETIELLAMPRGLQLCADLRFLQNYSRE